MRSYLALLFLCLQVAAVLSDDEETKKKYEKAIADCNEKWGITKEALEKAKSEEIDWSLEKNKVEKDGKINKEMGHVVLTKLEEQYKINDTKVASDALDQCAEKMKGIKDVGCEVGACLGNGMKEEWHKFLPK